LDRVACGGGEPSTNFTLDVTCNKCKSAQVYISAHSEFMAEVEAMLSPKEDQLSKLGHQERNKQ
jgi:hypothetical protein